MAFASVPPGFIDLENASEMERRKQYSIVGVCVDYMTPYKTGGTDYTIKFTLHDPVWSHGLGMPFRFFRKDIQQLPDIKGQGDVVILRGVATGDYQSQKVGLSFAGDAPSCQWVVLPGDELRYISSLEDFKRRARWSKNANIAHDSDGARLNMAVLAYAKWIAEQEDPTRWPGLAPPTAPEIQSNMRSGGGNPSPSKRRLCRVQDLQHPPESRRYFVDLLGEVRKVWSQDWRTELYLTDYTTHDQLYDYRYMDDSICGQEGDPYGYIAPSSNKWPGPWGKMTIAITLWDEHARHANENVKVGNFVVLRNVQIKMDKARSYLEGNLRGDRLNPGKVNVNLVKPSEDPDNEELKALLSRKRTYERKTREENKMFQRHAPQKDKRDKESQTALEEEQKNKKTKARNRKKIKAKTGAEQSDGKAIVAPNREALKSNAHVRCHNIPVPCKTIVDILDPDILERKTAEGNAFRLPFHNCKYKAKVRVVDFFPDNIADFAAPRMVSDYDILSDDEENDDGDIDLMREDQDKIKWEWCFFLLVEDARPQAFGDGEPKRMELLVADADGDFLLKMDACNLRDGKNAQRLALLKEKLFYLWGDLQERKEESGSAEALSVKPNSIPFECLIKEYGLPVQAPDEQLKDGVVYDRMFRLYGTTI